MQTMLPATRTPSSADTTYGKRKRTSSLDEEYLPLSKIPRPDAASGKTPTGTATKLTRRSPTPPADCASNFPVLFFKSDIIQKLSASRTVTVNPETLPRLRVPMAPVLRQVIFIRKKSNDNPKRVCLIMEAGGVEQTSPTNVKSEPAETYSTPSHNDSQSSQTKRARLVGFLYVSDYKVKKSTDGTMYVHLELAIPQPFVEWEAVSSQPPISVDINKRGPLYPKWFPTMLQPDGEKMARVYDALRIVEQEPHSMVCSMFYKILQHEKQKTMHKLLVPSNETSETSARDSVCTKAIT